MNTTLQDRLAALQHDCARFERTLCDLTTRMVFRKDDIRSAREREKLEADGKGRPEGRVREITKGAFDMLARLGHDGPTSKKEIADFLRGVNMPFATDTVENEARSRGIKGNSGPGRPRKQLK